MSELTFMGYPSQRVTWVVIGVGLALTTLTMVLVQDDEFLLYAGVAIGVGMVVGSTVVNYVAVKGSERGAGAGDDGDADGGDDDDGEGDDAGDASR